jgi:thioredoxin 1
MWEVTSADNDSMSNDVEHESVHFVKVDVDELPELAAELGVRAMPTFIVMHNGKPVQQLLGADKNALEKLVDKASLLQ